MQNPVDFKVDFLKLLFKIFHQKSKLLAEYQDHFLKQDCQ